MSESKLLSVDEALGKLHSVLKITDQMRVNLSSGHGFVLASDFVASNDFPIFATSSMDGFALRFEDIQSSSREKPSELNVIGDIPAGFQGASEISNGEAMRIMTGAPLPRGANAVIPVEDTDIQDRGPAFSLPDKVSVYRPLNENQYMRPRGQDYQKGQLLISAGKQLRPQDIALMAMNGQSQINVFRRPKVALFSSGDELQIPGKSLDPGQIYDSNSYSLGALIESTGAELHELPIAPDNLSEILAILDEAVELNPELIISSAGVSVGAHDYVRDALILNGHLDFWRVNVRPGKPFAFGEYRGVPFMGLPGNPVSSFVSFEVFGRPVLFSMQGMKDWKRNIMFGKLAEDIHSDGRESYLRAIYHEEKSKILVSLTGHQGSGNLYSLVQANALIKIPAGKKALKAGADVEIWPFA